MFFVPCIVTLIRCQYNEYFRQNLYVKELAAPKKYMSTVINKQKTDVKSYRNPHQIYPYKINKAFLHDVNFQRVCPPQKKEPERPLQT